MTFDAVGWITVDVRAGVFGRSSRGALTGDVSARLPVQPVSPCMLVLAEGRRSRRPHPRCCCRSRCCAGGGGAGGGNL